MTPPPNPESSSHLLIHYHRTSGNYDRAGLWVWDPRPAHRLGAHEVLAAENDDFGALFRVGLGDFHFEGDPTGRIGFIPRVRQSWDYKDGKDRYWTVGSPREFWIIENDPVIYFERPDVSHRVCSAFLDEPDRLVMVLSHPVRVDDVPKIKLVVQGHDGHTRPAVRLQLHEIFENRSRLLEAFLGEPLPDVRGPWNVRLDGYQPGALMPRGVLRNAERFFTDQPLGAIYSPEQTTFRLFSPPAQSASLILQDNPEDSYGHTEMPLEDDGHGVWSTTVSGDLEGKHYSFRVVHPGDARGVVASDPYATNTVGTNRPARITNLRATDPEGFRSSRPVLPESPVDAVLYEVHVRDFTIADDSGVREKGRYLGFVEQGTRLVGADDIATGLDHLRELGVTHVQLLPVQDFDNDERRPMYNWGYMTAFFNSPEGWFATSIRGDARVRELKQLIDGLHRAGLGVVMDVVYNHTGVQNTMERLCPNYYHRQHPDGTLWNGSGTGNEVDTSAPMVRQFLRDSLRHWVEEYQIDGFRFDLMGLMDLDVLEELRAELLELHPRLLFYGEPWIGGPAGIARITDKEVVASTGIGAFNDTYRNALKGEPEGPGPGYVQGGNHRDLVIRGMMGSIEDWAESPVESINYATCHDNLTLWDKLLESAPDVDDDSRRRMQRLTLGILAVSQGVLFLHGGSELERTKSGHHNSYNAGDGVNALRWHWKRDHRETFEFTRGMIALRRAHPVFRLRTAEDIAERVTFYHNHDLPVPEAIVMRLVGADLPGEDWTEAFVFVNPHPDDQTFVIPTPDETFRIYVRGSLAGDVPRDPVSGTLDVPGRSLAVIGR